jgi:aspartyl-tRNA(Asn)/glutamyl-tRNA(Gln) amidotransferase subunit C
MNTLSENEIRNLANLVKIDLNREELLFYHENLNKILEFVTSIDAVPIEDVEPMTYVSQGTQRMRDDVVTEKNERDLLLSNAPKTEAGLILVPKVIEACKIEE